MYYFQTLEAILLTKEPKRKIEKFKLFYKDFLDNKFIFDENYKAIEVIEP